MDLDAICALPVDGLATSDALLFIWVPPPILEQCFRVIRSWGFDYRTGIVWVKDRIGMGNYVRNRHEHLLIARRGELPLPTADSRPPSVLEAPRTVHSRKPVTAYELIERMYPELPRIELFARARRDGWAAWGNEAGGSPVADIFAASGLGPTDAAASEAG
jgi:N6-adenosine-specific RNA methylase IME4